MTWTSTQFSTIKKITTRYMVKLAGWPDEVPFASPGKISSKRHLERLIRGFGNKTIKFVPADAAEVGRRQLKFRLLENPLASTARKDCGVSRDLRCERTRSQLLRSRNEPLKTSERVPDKYDSE